MTLQEMLTLQGMVADDLHFTVSNAQVGRMLGNAMSVNVIERVNLHILKHTQHVPEDYEDRWVTGAAYVPLLSVQQPISRILVSKSPG